MKPIVSVKNISKSFTSGKDTVKALDCVDIEIHKGEIFGLLGPNGSGKTTLISILCGFLIPDSGEATIFGLNCTHESEKIQKKMNFVSGFGGISEFLSASELLNFYCMLYNLDNADQRVKKALELTGLEKYKDRRPADFSSGLGRRFLISKALLNDPEALLLDEPTVGLDVDAAINLRSLVTKMKKQGKTILLTTHNMKEAEELCDRVGLIRDGKIIACGKFSELRDKFFPHEVIEVRCKKPGTIEKILSKEKSIALIKRSGNSIKIFLKSENDAPKVLKLITCAKAEILSINTIEPELEDLYTKLMRRGKYE
jgi:ABC-2 type transport system ATP-binding protein